MNKITLIIVALLLWTHVAPQVHSYYGARQVAEQVNCGVGYTFFLTELEFSFKIACPEEDRERIEQMFNPN